MMRFDKKIKQYFLGDKPIRSFLGFLLGGLLGIWTNVDDDQKINASLIIGCLVVIVIIIGVVRAKNKSKKESQRNDLNIYELTAFAEPHDFAILMRNKSDDHYIVIDKVIELDPHPNINTTTDIGKMGWNPKDVVIHKPQSNFDVKPIYEKLNMHLEFEKGDGEKYCLSSLSKPLLEKRNIELYFQKTTFRTIQKIKENILQDVNLLIDFGSTKPSQNRIPNSFCLHYVVEFSDDNILVCKRSNDVEYYPGYWSFSGEEQLAEVDFSRDEGLLILFKRAILEEIFPFGTTGFKTIGLAEIDYRWNLVAEFIESYKAWSIIFESEIANFSITGFIRLKLSVKEYREKYKELANLMLGHRYDEGRLFYASKCQLEDLLFGHSCEVKAVYSDHSDIIKKDKLHPSSRYRIIRYLKAKTGREISLLDYVKRNPKNKILKG